MSAYAIKVLLTEKDESGNLSQRWETSETFKSFRLMKNRFDKLARENRTRNKVMSQDDKVVGLTHEYLTIEEDK